MSRLFTCASETNPAISVLPNVVHQSVLGHTCASDMIGAVKPDAGTSVVFSAWGTGVVHPAAASANTMADEELKNRFIKITRLQEAPVPLSYLLPSRTQALHPKHCQTPRSWMTQYQPTRVQTPELSGWFRAPHCLPTKPSCCVAKDRREHFREAVKMKR